MTYGEPIIGNCPWCMTGGCYGYCSRRDVDLIMPRPTPSVSTGSTSAPPAPIGCICPPGANLECQNPKCPRKPEVKP